MVGILVTGYSCHPFLTNIPKTFFPVLVILANIPENKYTYEVENRKLLFRVTIRQLIN